MSLSPKISQHAFPFALLLFQIALFFFLSHNIYYADTEIWAMHAGQYSFSNNYFSNTIISKPLFYFIIRITRAFHSDALGLWSTMRIIFALLGASSLWLTYKIIHAISKNKLAAISAVILILSCSFFLSRGFRVRSDNLALPFFLFSIWSLLKYKNSTKQLDLLMALVSTTLMILATPKAFIFVGLIAILTINRNSLMAFFMKKIKVYKAILFFSLATSLFLLFLPAYKSSFIYLAHTLLGKEQNTIAYLSVASFQYLVRFIKEDWAFSLALLMVLVVPLHKSLRSTLFSKLLLKRIYFATLYLLLCFFLIPDKLPFYLSSLLPIFALSIGILIPEILSRFHLGAGTKPSLQLSILLFMFALQSGYKGFQLYKLNNNLNQKILWNQVNKYLKEQTGSPTIYDSIGLFTYYPSRVDYFPGQGLAESTEWGILRIIESQPSIIIPTGRTQFLGKSFFNFLSNNYIPINNGLYVKSHKLSAFENNISALQDYLESVHPSSVLEIVFYDMSEKMTYFKSSQDKNLVPIRYFYPYGPLDLASVSQIVTNESSDLRASLYGQIRGDLNDSTQKIFNFDRNY